MSQSEGFEVEGKERMVCKLKKSLCQASRYWFLRFDEVWTFLDFNEIVDQYIHLKVCGSKFIILVLYVDDILLANNDIGLLRKTKHTI